MKQFTLKSEDSPFAITITFDPLKKRQACSEIYFESKISLLPSDIPITISALLKTNSAPSKPSAKASSPRKKSFAGSEPDILYPSINDCFEFLLLQLGDYFPNKITFSGPAQSIPGSPTPSSIIDITFTAQGDAKQHRSNKTAAHTYHTKLELYPDDTLSKSKSLKANIEDMITEDQILRICRIRNALTKEKANIILPNSLKFTPTDESKIVYDDFVVLHASPRSSRSPRSSIEESPHIFSRRSSDAKTPTRKLRASSMQQEKDTPPASPAKDLSLDQQLTGQNSNNPGASSSGS